MINFEGVTPEELQIFAEHIDNKVFMQRAMARVRQIRAAQAVRSVGGQRPVRGLNQELVSLPEANIDPSYYFSRLHEEREANPDRMASEENVWQDPEFLPFELKHHPELRPIVDHTGRPVFFQDKQGE